MLRWCGELHNSRKSTRRSSTTTDYPPPPCTLHLADRDQESVTLLRAWPGASQCDAGIVARVSKERRRKVECGKCCDAGPGCRAEVTKRDSVRWLWLSTSQKPYRSEEYSAFGCFGGGKCEVMQHTIATQETEASVKVRWEAKESEGEAVSLGGSSAWVGLSVYCWPQGCKRLLLTQKPGRSGQHLV